MNNSQKIYIGLGILFLLIGIIGTYMFTTNSRNPSDGNQQTTLNPGESYPIENEALIPPEEIRIETLDETLANPTSNGENKKMTIQEKLQTQKPAMSIDSKKSYMATINTSQGNIKVKLYADKVPVTVNNFVALSKMGFYNDVVFHRVIKGFMIQSGDPLGTGSGGPAYKFDDEKFEGDYKRGIIAMANAGSNTNGSQFFIMHADVPLPKNYVIFGEVVEGLDVLDAIANQPVVESEMGEMSKPVKADMISSVNIEEN